MSTYLPITLVLVLGLVACSPPPAGDAPSGGPAAAPRVPPADSSRHAHSGFLYGRITDTDGESYEGRLRWGTGDQEAFWSDSFDGTKYTQGATDGNPWAVHLPPELQKKGGIEVFGLEFGAERPVNLRRQFLARFGDIARVNAEFKYAHVRLKSGTVVSLDRFSAGDIDDGVRVWDAKRGVVDLDTRRIRTIEFMSTPPLADLPVRLHGIVRTARGEFSGFMQWNQRDGVGTDTLDGRTDDGEAALRYETIRSIARQSRDDALVTQIDGREIVLSDGEVGRRSRGVYVDDPRYGRVLITWEAFERAEFSPAGSGPAYGDFTPGRPIAGTVSTRAGRRLTGRLVYDFDETETTETLDVSLNGVDYAIPFDLIAAIVPPGREGRGTEWGRVVLRSGEELTPERSGDLADRNVGLLIFVDGREQPEFVAWADVAQIDLDESGAR